MSITETILDEIRRGVPRNDIAIGYAAARRLKGAERPDWARINAALRAAFKNDGLFFLQLRADLILRGLIRPQRTIPDDHQHLLGLGRAAVYPPRPKVFA